MATSKPKKKIKTLDDFAAAIHKDYLTIDEKVGKIHDEMVTIRDEMVTKGEFKEVRDDVKRITDAMVSKADLEETIRTNSASHSTPSISKSSAPASDTSKRNSA
jgi:hypothetical protein